MAEIRWPTPINTPSTPTTPTTERPVYTSSLFATAPVPAAGVAMEAAVTEFWRIANFSPDLTAANVDNLVTMLTATIDAIQVAQTSLARVRALLGG